jgi:hypothetical protein
MLLGRLDLAAARFCDARRGTRGSLCSSAAAAASHGLAASFSTRGRATKRHLGMRRTSTAPGPADEAGDDEGYASAKRGRQDSLCLSRLESPHPRLEELTPRHRDGEIRLHCMHGLLCLLGSEHSNAAGCQRSRRVPVPPVRWSYPPARPARRCCGVVPKLNLDRVPSWHG